MKISRRNFFKSLGGLFTASGLSHFTAVATSNAAESKSIDSGRIGIVWLGHGSFLFTSVKKRTILLDPWIKTNPKCPVKFRETVFSEVSI